MITNYNNTTTSNTISMDILSIGDIFIEISYYYNIKKYNQGMVWYHILLKRPIKRPVPWNLQFPIVLQHSLIYTTPPFYP
jgi:hypothetical protein